jgi:Fe2+ or Zn2+ uptake regulation protein
VIDIAECFVREMESRIAATHGFTAVTHKLEFFGLCPRCKPVSSKPETSQIGPANCG